MVSFFVCVLLTMKSCQGMSPPSSWITRKKTKKNLWNPLTDGMFFIWFTVFYIKFLSFMLSKHCEITSVTVNYTFSCVCVCVFCAVAESWEKNPKVKYHSESQPLVSNKTARRFIEFNTVLCSLFYARFCIFFLTYICEST